MVLFKYFMVNEEWRFSNRNTQNVVVEDCVFWCGWGKTCDIGLATACAEIKDVVFDRRLVSKTNDENLINEACRIVEQTFAEEFEGCTITELRYDIDVENKFAAEIEKYHKESFLYNIKCKGS